VRNQKGNSIGTLIGGGVNILLRNVWKESEGKKEKTKVLTQWSCK
jgi:hypothetical protein